MLHFQKAIEKNPLNENKNKRAQNEVHSMTNIMHIKILIKYLGIIP